MKKFTIMRRMTVPFEFVEPYETVAIRNHDQTLDKLNSRGGLDPVELYCVMNGLRWGQTTITEPDALLWIKEELRKWEAVKRTIIMEKVKDKLTLVQNCAGCIGSKETLAEYKDEVWKDIKEIREILE